MSDELRDAIAKAQHAASGFGVIPWANLTEREHECWRESAGAVLSALRTGGWAVVKLPKSGGPDDDGQEWFGDGDIRVDHSARGSEYPSIYLGSRPFAPEDLRLEAADMLAAADAAERAS